MKPIKAHAVGAAPGKVILFGEHAVVYGRPAIAAALSHGLGVVVDTSPGGARLHVPRWGRNGLVVEASVGASVGTDAVSRAFERALELIQIDGSVGIDVTIDGELPLGVGLGSSAAFSVSLLRGLADYVNTPLTDETLRSHAHELESIFHGNPSGLDHSVIIQNDCLRFHPTTSPRFTTATLALELPLVVAWTPRRGTTKDAVAHVASLVRRQPDLSNRIFTTIEAIVDTACEALRSGDLKNLGDLMNMNHGLLSALGVVSDQNDRMVSIAREAGALGAKVTGAGFGGAVIALAPGCGEQVCDALRKAGFPALMNLIRNH